MTTNKPLRALFADHYWDSFEDSKDIIMKHVDFVLSLYFARPPVAGAEVGRDVEQLRTLLPRYVSSFAREIAGEAEHDMGDEHRGEAKTYALARWFDAALSPPVAERGGGE